MKRFRFLLLSIIVLMSVIVAVPVGAATVLDVPEKLTTVTEKAEISVKTPAGGYATIEVIGTYSGIVRKMGTPTTANRTATVIFNGRGDNGDFLTSGVYTVRATVGGVSTYSKIFIISSTPGVTLSGYAAPNQLDVGKGFAVKGKISSEVPLTSVSVLLKDESGKTLQSAQAEPNDNKFDLGIFDEQIVFKTLGAPKNPTPYSIEIRVATSLGEYLLSKDDFRLYPLPTKWTQVARNSELSAFFKSEVYRYRYIRNSFINRSITIDSAWLEKNIIDFPFYHIRDNRINAYAKKNYEGTLSAIENTKMVVRYDDGEVRFDLRELVLGHSGDGSFNSRLTSEFNLSGHSMGLTTDINCQIPVNGRTAKSNDNFRLIKAEVQKLKFVSSKKEGSLVTYTIKYKGDKPTDGKPVPDELYNYLLHEAAFVKNGFNWGGYFSTTDAMHYTLYEQPKGSPRLKLIP